METHPQKTQSIPGFDPEVDPMFSPETRGSAGLPGRCSKAASNHHLYIPFNDLDLQHLPVEWCYQDTLQHIRDIGQRVVKLRVRKLSPDRPVEDPRLRKYGHHGTGFVTFDLYQKAPVVHTNRHVVYDQYEAGLTEVIFFYEGDSDGIQCTGISHGFRSTLGMDHSIFTLQQPLPEAVVTWQNGPTSSGQSDNQGRTQEAAARKAEKLNETFSMSNIADQSATVVIISHPHGSRKQVSVGNMSTRYKVLPTYDAPTCPGSSGAPLLRLCTKDNKDNRPVLSNGLPDVTAGRSLHQGAYIAEQNTTRGIGSLRAFISVPYGELQDASLLGRWMATFISKISNSMFDLLHRGERGRFKLSLRDRCIVRFSAFLLFYGAFSVVGPAWTMAGIILLNFGGIPMAESRANALRQAVVDVLFKFLDLAAMQGLTELADGLVSPADRGWLMTALLALPYFLISQIFDLARSKRPRVMPRFVNRLERWAEPLTPKLSSFYNFLWLYGLYCVVGPPWTLRALVISLIAISIYKKSARSFGVGLGVVYGLSTPLHLAAMHGVTELADLLVPLSDRGWLWTALLTLPGFLTSQIVAAAMELLALAWSKRPRGTLRVVGWLMRRAKAVALWVVNWLMRRAKAVAGELLRLWRLSLTNRPEQGPLVQCFHQCSVFLHIYVLFCVVGPPWSWAALVVNVICNVCLLSVPGSRGPDGPRGPRFFHKMEVNMLFLSVYWGAMHGVTELADVLVSPDDRGWLWTALLMLSHFLVCLVMPLTPVFACFVFAWSKLPRVWLRVEDWLGRWAATLVHKLWSVWRLSRTDRDEAGLLAQCIRHFCGFLCFFVLFCAVGPPWTLAAVVFFLVILLMAMHWACDRSDTVLLISLYLSVYLAAMHWVTQLAYVLAPHDDRGWLWTALLALSYFLIYLVIRSTAVRKLQGS